MTVQELIETLSQIEDKNIRVMTKGYEGGWNDLVCTPRELKVALNVNEEWYYGSHERIEDVSRDDLHKYEIVKAIIL